MRHLNKKGDEIVEAAIVFPVIILVILSLIMLMIFFYSSLEKQLELHEGMIMASKTENYIFRAIYRENTVSSGIGGQVSKVMKKDIRAGIYVIDEAQIIRLGRFVGNEDN